MKLHIPTYSKIRNESRSMALGLIVVGAGLGMYLNFFCGNIGWNNFLMLGALLLLPNWNNLLKLRLPLSTNTFILIILFQFLCIAYMVGGGIFDSNGLIYILFTIFLLIGIMSQNKNDMLMSKVVFYSWLFGWICLIFCGYSLVSGIFFMEYERIHRGIDDGIILIDLSMASNLYTFVVCCLYYLKSSRIYSIFGGLGIVLSMIMLIVLGKRTPLLVSMFAIIIYLLRFYPISRKIRKTTVYYFLLIILILISLMQIPDLNEQFMLVWERSMGGIVDMFSGTSTTGEAAVTRYELRHWASDYIEHNFTFLNYIFGAGYMTKWLDSPLLQAYLDMGILGFGFYLYYVIIKPLRITFSKLSSNNLIFWGCALNFYNILSSLNSGTPYGHIRWIPLIVLILTIIQTKSSKKGNEKALCNI